MNGTADVPAWAPVDGCVIGVPLMYAIGHVLAEAPDEGLDVWLWKRGYDRASRAELLTLRDYMLEVGGEAGEDAGRMLAREALLTTAEVAQRLGVTPRQVRYVLQGTKIRGRLHYAESDVEEFRAARQSYSSAA